MSQLPVAMYTSHPKQPYIEYNPVENIQPTNLLEMRACTIHLARRTLLHHEHYDAYEFANVAPSDSLPAIRYQTTCNTYLDLDEEISDELMMQIVNGIEEQLQSKNIMDNTLNEVAMDDDNAGLPKKGAAEEYLVSNMCNTVYADQYTDSALMNTAIGESNKKRPRLQCSG